ncbi:hypothetical protein, partial [Klebsiella pneumoniae]|uniref:hypothetical protein n=1 Tax=Klebsiella pneumoniae TaxID=573 RepID=UPI00349EEBC8
MPRQHEQVSRYKQLTDYHKEEYERQSQKLDHIKQESKEVMEKYQNALNVLKTPLNIPYKIETEKVGGLFSKETQETGSVVIDKNEFESLQEQVTASQLIIKDYEYIKEGLALKEAKQRCK